MEIILTKKNGKYAYFQEKMTNYAKILVQIACSVTSMTTLTTMPPYREKKTQDAPSAITGCHILRDI